MVRSANRQKSARGEGAQLRGEILDATAELITQAGTVSDLTLRGIARRVGVSPMAIYSHFASVDEIVSVLKVDNYGELADCLRAAVTNETDPREAIRALAHAYVAYGLEEPGRYAVLFSTPVDSPTVPDGQDILGREALDVLVGAVARYLDSEPSDAEAWMLCLHLWTALHGIVHLRLMRATVSWPSEISETDSLIDRLLPTSKQV